ncbi:MAG: S-methyl-5-thioribose-1-phosphate isomerase [Pseudohongiella sp.]|nr:S-methyl-5-thioribose-1-phosphate isomerase [Pseudohongiella sp.]MDP2126141.1 S-methyl-5-thioribose-1-phosphate isomerase [Pseudohongiella sp.]
MVMSSAPQQTTLWYDGQDNCLKVIDQTRLPFEVEVLALNTLEQAADAIVSMKVRGAPLIGITAAFGVYLSVRTDSGSLRYACESLLRTRPTAVNLRWALDRMYNSLKDLPEQQLAPAALELAQRLLAEDAAACGAIGDFGLDILTKLYQQKRELQGQDTVLNILTHCNAGWLATGAWGTALAPVYKAKLAGLPVHVWVDETRPRNQGASLTAWELAQSSVPHTLITDNAGGHLMQHGQVDICLVGSDRTTSTGDVCNKIGTYLKALAAYDNLIPFYAALPVSTVDFEAADGVSEIPIEERAADEVTHVQGIDDAGQLRRVQTSHPGTRVSNYGFDVTPARLVTGLITELGVFPATVQGLLSLKIQIR